jgi:hypothetical protein
MYEKKGDLMDVCGALTNKKIINQRGTVRVHYIFDV